MAKGQIRSNREAKKPKADKNQPKKGAESAYQKSQGKGGASADPFAKKN